MEGIEIVSGSRIVRKIGLEIKKKAVAENFQATALCFFIYCSLLYPRYLMPDQIIAQLVEHYF
jgi:hypothetical protein